MPSLNSYKEISIEGIEWTQEQGFKLEGISDTSVWDTVKEGRVLIGWVLIYHHPSLVPTD